MAASVNQAQLALYDELCELIEHAGLERLRFLKAALESPRRQFSHYAGLSDEQAEQLLSLASARLRRLRAETPHTRRRAMPPAGAGMAAAKQAQLELLDGPEHALYHDSARYGYFSILSKDGGTGRPRQHSYALSKLEQVLRLLPKDRDSYLSQAEFIAPNRRVVNLARIGLLFVDLDCYKLNLTPDAALWHLLHECDERGIPHPSIVINSGRGVYGKWLLDGTIPRQALPRWNRLQAELVSAFERIGADPAAKDASRVLRIVGTVNTKSNEVVRVIHVTRGLDGEPVRYGFEQLAEYLMPADRREIEAARKARQEAKEARQEVRLRLVHENRNTAGLRKLSGRQLAWHRLEDLRTLAALRGGVQEGWRMLWMFWALNFLLLSGATNSAQMFHEARALAREIGFLEGWTEGDLSTLYKKAQAFERGERIAHDGREYPPLYTPRNQTLIEVFRITPDEERQLRTIVSESTARERHAERQSARRRAAGAVDRETYEARARANQERARALHAQGLSLRQIAQQIGVSVASAFGYIKGAE